MGGILLLIAFVSIGMLVNWFLKREAGKIPPGGLFDFRDPVSLTEAKIKPQPDAPAMPRRERRPATEGRASMPTTTKPPSPPRPRRAVDEEPEDMRDYDLARKYGVKPGFQERRGGLGKKARKW